MSVPPRVLSRLESAAKNRVYSESVKIIRRYDASSGDLGAVADAERRPHNFCYKKCVKQRATPLQVEEIWPRNRRSASLPARRSAEGEQPLLVCYGWVGTEQNPFDPTEDRGIGADSQGKAEDRQDGKARTAPQHPETEAEVLKRCLDH